VLTMPELPASHASAGRAGARLLLVGLAAAGALHAAASDADWERFEVRFAEAPAPWRTGGRKVTAEFPPDPDAPGARFLSVTDPRGYGQAVCPERIPVRAMMEIRAVAVVRCAGGEGGKAVVDLQGYDDADQRLHYRIVIGETTESGWTELSETFTAPPGTAYLKLRFCPAWPRQPGKPANGTALLRSVIFERVPQPEPTRTYVSDVAARDLADLGDYVPPPWTPVVLGQDGRVGCWGREYVWGGGPFPARVSSRGRDLLAAPIALRWRAESAGEVRAGEWRTDLAGRSRVVRSARLSGGCSGKAVVTVEYDGAVRVDLDLDFGETALSGLDLVVPLRTEAAGFLHYDHGIGAWIRPFPWSGALAEKGERFSSKFLPFLWLGDDDVGLCLFTESDRDWLPHDDESAVEIVRAPGQVRLVLHLVRAEAPVAVGRRRYTFGLEATPVRPLPPDFRQTHIVHIPGYFGVWKGRKPGSLLERVNLAEVKKAGVGCLGLHAWWADRVCGFRPAWEEDFRAFMQEADRVGIKVQTYLAFMLASKTTFREIEGAESWLKIPSYGAWNASSAEPYRGFNTCPESGYSQFLVRGALAMAERYGISGVYWDNHPAMCKNAAHGCGYEAAAGARTVRRPTCAMWSARRLLKEVYERLKRRDPNAFVSVHFSWFPHPYLMFADTLLTGEGVGKKKNNQLVNGGEVDRIPLSAFRAELRGTKFGLKTCFCLYESQPYLPASLVAGECFLHDVDVRKFDKIGWIAPVWRAFDEFNTSSARFVGYWDLEGKAFPAGMIKTSAYVREAEALLVAANLTRADGETVIDLKAVLPNAVRFLVRDVLKGADVPVTDGRARVVLPKDEYALLRVAGE